MVLGGVLFLVFQKYTLNGLLLETQFSVDLGWSLVLGALLS